MQYCDNGQRITNKFLSEYNNNKPVVFPYCFLFADKFTVLPGLFLLLGPSGLEALLVSQVYLHLGLQNLDQTERGNIIL